MSLVSTTKFAGISFLSGSITYMHVWLLFSTYVIRIYVRYTLISIYLPCSACTTSCVCISFTQVLTYCDMVTYGGGFMSFASFSYNALDATSVNTDNDWYRLSYSKNAELYDPLGSPGSVSYWRDYTKMASSDIVMFRTGNFKHWAVIKMSQVVKGSSYTVAVTASSGSFGNPSLDNNLYIYFRTGMSQDPCIVFGNDGSAGYLNYMIYGEDHGWSTLRNANGDALALTRGTRKSGYCPCCPSVTCCRQPYRAAGFIYNV